MARAIDIDAALDRYYAEWELQDICSGEDDRDWLMKCINEAPTIEAESVNRAKWEFGRQNGAAGYYCTKCQSGFTGENAEWIAKEHDFCPKCGAKMNYEEEQA